MNIYEYYDHMGVTVVLSGDEIDARFKEPLRVEAKSIHAAYLGICEQIMLSCGHRENVLGVGFDYRSGSTMAKYAYGFQIDTPQGAEINGVGERAESRMAAIERGIRTWIAVCSR